MRRASRSGQGPSAAPAPDRPDRGQSESSQQRWRTGTTPATPIRRAHRRPRGSCRRSSRRRPSAAGRACRCAGCGRWCGRNARKHWPWWCWRWAIRRCLPPLRGSQNLQGTPPAPPASCGLQCVPGNARRQRAATAGRPRNACAPPLRPACATNAAHRPLQTGATRTAQSGRARCPAAPKPAPWHPATGRGSPWHRPPGKSPLWQTGVKTPSGTAASG